MSNISASQAKFDECYITASEITKHLGISRTGFFYGRLAGKLPDPIVANDGRLYMWERTPEILSKVEEWKSAIVSRKVT